MRKSLVAVALVTLVAVAVPAAAGAKTIKYKGKTSSGHKITFKVKGKRIYDPVAGMPIHCLSIQGGGSPMTGAELLHPKGWIKIGDKVKFWTNEKPTYYYNEVRKNQQFSSRKGRGGVITGRLRMQYSFMIPKYPIGTFVIYSCLGNATFKARPAR